jgi:hypothetical protein
MPLWQCSIGPVEGATTISIMTLSITTLSTMTLAITNHDP